MIGQSGQDIQDRTFRTGIPSQDSQAGTGPSRKDRTEWLQQNSWDRTAGQGSQENNIRTGQREQNRIVRNTTS